MADNSLKDEIELEVRAATKHRRFTIIVSVAVILCGSIGTVMWTRSHPQTQVRSKTEAVAENISTKANTESEVETKNKPDQSTPTKTDAPSSTSQVQTSTPQQYEPAAQGINRAKFIADGNTVMAHYSQIVQQVTFVSSMSTNEKVNHIKQAATLDKQYFSQVTDLRANLVMAHVSSGSFMEAVELAESGASKISVGLTFMSYWADDQSRSGDLQIGLGSITEGSNILLDLSNKLNQL